MIARTIGKRPVSSQPHKLPILNEDLLHVGVLTASELFEIYQELTGNPNQRKLAGYSSDYQPTADDFVIRYIKKIYILSNDRVARYLAIGVGTLVYRYRTIDILGLSDYFDNNNSSKIRRFYDEALKNRFPMIDLGRNLLPDERTSALTECCFNIFMPPSVKSMDFDGVINVRNEFFANGARPERERFNVLMSCGLKRIIAEYNAYVPYGSYELDDPANKLILPNSLNPNFNRTGADFESRLKKSQLTETELHLMNKISRKRGGASATDLMAKGGDAHDDVFLRYVDDL